MADAAPDKKEKKKKEKTSEEDKKPKKSSLKKEKVEEPKPKETAEEPKPNKTAEEPKPNKTAEEPKPKETAEEPKPNKTAEEPKPKETAEEPKPNENSPVVENPPADIQEPKRVEIEEPLKPEANDPEVAANHEEEPRPKPRRKPSKRSLELEIDDEKLNQLKEAFQIFDFDHDGVIDKDDLRKSLIAMGQEIEDIHDEELEKMMSEACQPLDFDAFIMLLGYRTIELDSEEVLRDALSRWDYDGSGLISEEKFRHDLMHLGDKFSEKEVDMALEDAPVTKGMGFYKDIRMIDYGKFCHILCGLRKKTQPSLEEYGLDVSA